MARAYSEKLKMKLRCGDPAVFGCAAFVNNDNNDEDLCAPHFG